MAAETTGDSPRVVITGVSRGIGLATALAFAAMGARVAGIHHEEDQQVTASVEQAIRHAGGSPLIMRGDTRSTTDVDRLADHAASRWGGFDVWVNNAARLLVQSFMSTPESAWLDLLNSNLLGYVRGARAAARHMIPESQGSIINVSSAVDSFPPDQMVSYTTAKGGVGGLTRSLSVELGKYGIRVNAVAPGATDTPLNRESWSDEVRANYRDRIPLRRIAEPAEIADVIVAISSRSFRYVTGQVLTIDGGLTLNGSVGHKSA